MCLPRWCLRISRSPRKLSITGRVPPSSLETGSEKKPFLTAFGLQKEIPGLFNVLLEAFRTSSRGSLRSCPEDPVSDLGREAPQMEKRQQPSGPRCSGHIVISYRLGNSFAHSNIQIGVNHPSQSLVSAQQSRRVCRNSITSHYDPRFVLRTVKHPSGPHLATLDLATSTLLPPIR